MRNGGGRLWPLWVHLHTGVRNEAPHQFAEAISVLLHRHRVPSGTARSQWVSGRGRWPDPSHGSDGMGGVSPGPVFAAPIQSQGNPSFWQAQWTPQQWWKRAPSTTYRLAVEPNKQQMYTSSDWSCTVAATRTAPSVFLSTFPHISFSFFFWCCHRLVFDFLLLESNWSTRPAQLWYLKGTYYSSCPAPKLILLN